MNSYNTYMSEVYINDADRALAAAVWARDNIKTWDIELESLLGDNPLYVFKFASNVDATHFALKWS